MAKKHIVDFYAKKPVKEPVQVSFITKKGQPISFGAHEIVKEKVEVRFRAKDKK